MSSFAYTDDKLQAGDPNTAAHFLNARNLMESAPLQTFVYPADFGGPNANAAQMALRGTLDMRPGGKAVKFLMTTIDKDLAADAQLKNGAAANDNEQLQVQAHAIPDVAPEQYEPFANASLDQVENYFKRKALESATVDTLISALKGEHLVPGEDLGKWFDVRCRDYRPMQGQVSLREFYQFLEDLLPTDDDLHPLLEKDRRCPKSLSGIASDLGSVSTAVARAKLIKGQSDLEKAARQKGIKGQQWWTSGSKRSAGINAVEDELAARMARLEGTVVAAIGGNANSNLQLASSTNPFAAIDAAAVQGGINFPAPSQGIAALSNAASSAAMVNAATAAVQGQGAAQTGLQEQMRQAQLQIQMLQQQLQ